MAVETNSSTNIPEREVRSTLEVTAKGLDYLLMKRDDVTSDEIGHLHYIINDEIPRHATYPKISTPRQGLSRETQENLLGVSVIAGIFIMGGGMLAAIYIGGERTNERNFELQKIKVNAPIIVTATPQETSTALNIPISLETPRR